MVSLHTGKMGSGKSHEAASKIVLKLSRGGYVYTNIRLNFDSVAELVRLRHRRRIRPEQIRYIDLIDDERWHQAIEWGVQGEPVLLVLDEIHLWFNARDWAKTEKLHRGMLDFLSQTRKAAIDIVFICQSATLLEKQFRVQAEWEFYFRSFQDIYVPIFGKLPFRLRLMVQKDVENDKVIRRKIGSYDRAIFGTYDTAAMLSKQMQEREAQVKRLEPLRLERVPFFSRRTKIGFWVTLVLMIVIFYITK